MLPAYPAINLGRNNIIELNRAYWVAVNLMEVREDRYTINEAPAKPLAILSNVMTAIKNVILVSLLQAKQIKYYYPLL